jgi:hypothetical protein
MSGIALNYPLLRLIRTGSSAPRTWLSHHLGEIGVILLLCGSVLVPQWEISPSEPRIRRELFILLGIFAVYGWMLLVGKARGTRFRSYYVIGVVFSISVALSMAYGVQILHHDLSIRDFSEIPKSWLPMLFFSVGYGAQLSESGLRRLLNYLAFATILICLLGCAQFLDWKIALLLMPYYGDGGHNDYTLMVYHRIYSTLTNPNVLAQFLSWTLIVYVLALVFGVGSRLRNVAVAAFCLINIVLASSRYGILSAIFGFLYVVALALKTKHGLTKMLALVLLFVAFSGIFLMASQNGSYVISQRFDELRNPSQVASLRGRLDFLWVDAVQYFLSSPIVGHGPAKTIFAEVFTDSEFLDILKWYGLVGFVVYILYYCWPLLQIRRGLKRSVLLPPVLEQELRATLLVTRFGLVMLWMALFMNIGMFTCFNWYLMGYMWVWAGISVRAAEVVTEAASLASPASVCVGQPSAPWRPLAPVRSNIPVSNF